MADGDRRLANIFGALALAVADEMRQVTEVAAAHGAAGPSALVALHEFLDHPTIDELRRVVGLTHSGAVRLVDRLEEEEYVSRRAGPDARSVSIVLTTKGRGAARRVLAARAAAVDSVLGALGAGERAQLTELCEKLIAAVTGQRLAARAANRPPQAGWFCRLCDFDACGRPLGACPAATAVLSNEPNV